MMPQQDTECHLLYTAILNIIYSKVIKNTTHSERSAPVINCRPGLGGLSTVVLKCTTVLYIYYAKHKF